MNQNASRDKVKEITRIRAVANGEFCPAEGLLSSFILGFLPVILYGRFTFAGYLRLFIACGKPFNNRPYVSMMPRS
jgi:hypothetical protein